MRGVSRTARGHREQDACSARWHAACCAVNMGKIPHGHMRGEKAGWIDVVGPTNAEIDELVRTFSIPKRMLSHALDPDERPRVEHENGVTLIVLQVPYAESKRAALPYVTIP